MNSSIAALPIANFFAVLADEEEELTKQGESAVVPDCTRELILKRLQQRGHAFRLDPMQTPRTMPTREKKTMPTKTAVPYLIRCLRCNMSSLVPRMIAFYTFGTVPTTAFRAVHVRVFFGSVGAAQSPTVVSSCKRLIQTRLIDGDVSERHRGTPCRQKYNPHTVEYSANGRVQ